MDLKFHWFRVGAVFLVQWQNLSLGTSAFTCFCILIIGHQGVEKDFYFMSRAQFFQLQGVMTQPPGDC